MFSSFSLGLYETVASCAPKGMLGWNPSTLRSFINSAGFLPLVSPLLPTDHFRCHNSKAALQKTYVWKSSIFTLLSSESHHLSHQPQDKSMRGPHKTFGMSKLSLFAMQSFFFSPRLCSLWDYLQKELQTTQAFIPIRVRKAFAPCLWVSQALHPLWHPRVPH